MKKKRQKDVPQSHPGHAPSAMPTSTPVAASRTGPSENSSGKWQTIFLIQFWNPLILKFNLFFEVNFNGIICSFFPTKRRETEQLKERKHLLLETVDNH